MRLIKRQSKATYKGKDGKDKHYYNYLLELDNGKRVAIKPAINTDDNKDYLVLDAVAVYEGR